MMVIIIVIDVVVVVVVVVIVLVDQPAVSDWKQVVDSGFGRLQRFHSTHDLLFLMRSFNFFVVSLLLFFAGEKSASSSFLNSKCKFFLNNLAHPHCFFC
jgi:preprotein translocase subunit SecG